jgi:hypothetical protein
MYKRVNEWVGIPYSDCGTSEEQWNPPGNSQKSRSGILLDIAIYVKGVKRCTKYCPQ